MYAHMPGIANTKKKIGQVYVSVLATMHVMVSHSMEGGIEDGVSCRQICARCVDKPQPPQFWGDRSKSYMFQSRQYILMGAPVAR